MGVSLGLVESLSSDADLGDLCGLRGGTGQAGSAGW